MKRQHVIWYVGLFSLAFVCDRLTKMWALYSLADQAITIGPFLTFELEWNKGVSFGLFSQLSSHTAYYALMTSIGLCCLFFMYLACSNYKKQINVLSEVLVLAGALSNVVDRFTYGAVIDFIQIHAGTWYWPTFNVADACIVVGIFGILLRELVLAEPDESLFG
ncbi:MAG: signal peptidase II [Epsilonproteobacteria bacterium]|nr:signal peptidase II [Campylobacterota bacterium]